MKQYYLILLLGWTPMLLLGQNALTLQNGSILTVQGNASLTITGTTQLANGSRLVNNGTILLRPDAGVKTADWQDNTITGYAYGTGEFQFQGSLMQSIGSPNTFNRILVDNGGLDFTSNITANNWLFRNGIVNTNSFVAITMSTQDTAIRADSTNKGFATSRINGICRRYISPALVNSYIIPIGTATQNNSIMLDNLRAAPLTDVHYLDIGFGPKPGTDAGLIVRENGLPYLSVNNAGVWQITPDIAPGGGQYDLTLSLDGFQGLQDNSFAILERPVKSTNAGEWTVPEGSSLPPASTTGRTVSGGVASRTGLTSLGQFGIGMQSNPLPVNLLDFTAKRTSSTIVELDWQTAQEYNNKGFDIERRRDTGAAFSDIGFVASEASNGNSAQTLSYRYSDANADSGITYYRLKQIDLDGNSAYSIVRAVAGDGNGLSVALYPNPNHGQFALKVNGRDGRYRVIVTDIQGRRVQELEISGNTTQSVGGLRPGLYFVTIPDVFGAGRPFAEKVLVLP